MADDRAGPDTSAVARCLAEHWGLRDVTVEPHHGGMNSHTWYVTGGGARWVAKAVSASLQAQFTAGLAVASVLDSAGIPAGAPVPARDGRAVIVVDRHALALLTLVDGVGLTGTGDGNQRLIGATLSRVHRALAGVAVRDTEDFRPIDPEAAHLDVRPWVRPAVVAAVEAWERIPPASITAGLLHSDPCPQAFRFDQRTGACGLIDWGSAIRGPLTYDLASAVMYVGGIDRGRDLVDVYLAGGSPLPAAEVERTLLVMIRFRWAVQAEYFARRLAIGDLTGIESQAQNEEGLEDARQGLGVVSPR